MIETRELKVLKAVLPYGWSKQYALYINAL